MAVHFPTTMDLAPGELPPPWSKKSGDPKWVVRKQRVANKMHIFLADDGPTYLLRQPHFDKYISLIWHWWQPASPAERIRRACDKAQAKADKLNHRELYIRHEAELVDSGD